MRYSKGTNLFWMFSYLLLKSRSLRFMGVTIPKGTFLDGSSDKGSFLPAGNGRQTTYVSLVSLKLAQENEIQIPISF